MLLFGGHFVSALHLVSGDLQAHTGLKQLELQPLGTTIATRCDSMALHGFLRCDSMDSMKLVVLESGFQQLTMKLRFQQFVTVMFASRLKSNEGSISDIGAQLQRSIKCCAVPQYILMLTTSHASRGFVYDPKIAGFPIVWQNCGTHPTLASITPAGLTASTGSVRTHLPPPTTHDATTAN